MPKTKEMKLRYEGKKSNAAYEGSVSTESALSDPVFLDAEREVVNESSNESTCSQQAKRKRRTQSHFYTVVVVIRTI